jgi:hypothetical protein
MGPIKDLKGV